MLSILRVVSRHTLHVCPKLAGSTTASYSRQFSTLSEHPPTKHSHPPISSTVLYNGPLARTFRSLKIFSLASLGFATALTPFMFIIDTSLPFVARAALASIAMSTSAVSTALVGWCGQPYVATIRTLAGASQVKPEESDTSGAKIEGIQLETFSLALRQRFTTVYDPAFLTETRRPFAKWELAENVVLTRSAEESSEVPAEETVAETMDARGNVRGRWIVSWNVDRTKGVCRGEGKVQRFFNVHEEMLPPSLR